MRALNSWSCNVNWLGISLRHLDRMLDHHWLPLASCLLGEMKSKCLAESEPGTLDPKYNALTIRPTCLKCSPNKILFINIESKVLVITQWVAIRLIRVLAFIWLIRYLYLCFQANGKLLAGAVENLVNIWTISGKWHLEGLLMRGCGWPDHIKIITIDHFTVFVNQPQLR